MIEEKGRKHRNKPNRMNDAEIMVILLLFHSGGSRCFKLHLIINDKGEILNFMFTPGYVDDREPLKQGRFLETYSLSLKLTFHGWQWSYRSLHYECDACNDWIFMACNNC